MKRILNFFQTHRYAFIWTACYVFIMWAILLFLFNFDMFSGANWIRLAHSKLVGFPGFVFGILILAAIPLYIATTLIVVRNKSPLVKIKLPKFLQPVPASAPEKPTPTPEPTTAPAPSPEKKIPDTVPAELRAAYIRALDHMGNIQTSAFDLSNMTNSQKSVSTPDTPTQSTNELPLPSDFELPNEDFLSEPEMPNFSPMFQDLDFDSPSTPPSSGVPSISEQSPTPDNAITQYLAEHGKNYTIENGIVITDRDAIAIHDDPDFWIADDVNWFAAGQQKPSPIDALLSISAARGVRPVLYLAQTNILDLDARRAQWRQAGITTITDLSELN